jgi:hypothetical protein
MASVASCIPSDATILLRIEIASINLLLDPVEGKHLDEATGQSRYYFGEAMRDTNF